VEFETSGGDNLSPQRHYRCRCPWPSLAEFLTLAFRDYLSRRDNLSRGQMGALRLFLSTLWKRSPSSSSLSPMSGTMALYDDEAMVRLTVRTGRSRFQRLLAFLWLFFSWVAQPPRNPNGSRESRRRLLTSRVARTTFHEANHDLWPRPAPKTTFPGRRDLQTTRHTDFHSGLRPKIAQKAFDSSELVSCVVDS
jgi:hypothetical protein